MITIEKLEHGTAIKAGEHTLAIITDETDRNALDQFVILCNANYQELHLIGLEYEAKRKWNMDSNGNGRNWPVFSQREKLVNRLLHLAGIVDS